MFLGNALSTWEGVGSQDATVSTNPIGALELKSPVGGVLGWAKVGYLYSHVNITIPGDNKNLIFIDHT